MKKGVLLINLGSPDSPEVKDVRRYLSEFLMDKHVVTLPWLLRWILVHGIILRTRPTKSAEAYRSVWLEEGSPLVVISKQLTKQVQAELPDTPVALGMRYGSPSIVSAIHFLQAQGVEAIKVMPLYPQYAASTTQTALEAVNKSLRKVNPSLKIDVLPPFHGQSAYLDLLAAQVREAVHREGPGHLVFSYHGLPEQHIRSADPTGSHCLASANCCHTAPQACYNTCYRAQCSATSSGIASRLGLSDQDWSQAYQSRLGRQVWLKPYLIEHVRELAQRGVKRIILMSPSFVADCLETLEELDGEIRDIYIASGGLSLTRVPCLNDNLNWARLLASWA